MGIFSVPISIGDPQGENWIELNALVDTGASVVSLPTPLLVDLGIATHARQRFRVHRNGVKILDIGRARIRAEGKETSTLVAFNDEITPPLLGSLALEALFLGVDPVKRRLVPVDGLMVTPFMVD